MIKRREITLEEFHSKNGYSENKITFTKHQMQEYKDALKKQYRKEFKEDIIKQINTQ